MAGITRRVQTTTEPIAEITTVTNPVGIKDASDVRVSPATEATLAKSVPVAKAYRFNTALPTAEADLLAADIAPTNSPSSLRVYFQASVAGILRCARTVSAATVDENLNSGALLVANACYLFSIPWRTGDAINFEYSVTTGTFTIIVDEIGDGE